jgi:hypothetical protein
MKTVVFTSRFGVCDVRLAYDEAGRALLKALHGRWNPSRKGWVIHGSGIDTAVHGFQRLGFQVIVDGVTRPGTPTAKEGSDPAEAFLRGLPARLRQPAYRALARVLHPDTGGEVAAMAALNQAWERVS